MAAGDLIGYMVLNDSHVGERSWVVGPRIPSLEEAERQLTESRELPPYHGTGWFVAEIRLVSQQLELFGATS
ncbi:hypothetical protein M2272_005897 [Mycobacterium frederiksbergense]|uniref:YCII-related domain-containing protein n=1 Tax=Mycolicibacterium frederiksbergense TaxID=117567 RepID=A0ABT6L8E2_9MYCO|nr:hypothetical protein [Mycolicibacterium frederiksbergense]MDH6199229.1 hypothetical protein [Mycolicibacterium frederiksbergense]